jgi:isopenicillin-N epimerase
MKPDDERYWLSQRERIGLDAGTINLNTGTCGPVPIGVQRLLADLRTRLYNSPSDFCWRQLPVRLVRARSRLAGYLRVDPADLLLLNNATVALNLVVRSLNLPAGSEVLTTDFEYGAMRLLLEHMQRERGWKIVTAELPYLSEKPLDYIDAFAAKIGPQTRLAFFSHVMSATGVVVPAGEICRLAADAGAFSAVDGAHAPGLAPLNLRTVAADFYAANCHKWLLAPLGASFLHVRKELREELAPLVTSWGYGYDAEPDADSGWGGSYWARNLEFHGTQDRCPQLVLPEVLDFRASLDDSAVLKRQRYLAGQLRSRMVAAGFAPATPLDERLSGGLVAFEVPAVDPVKARNFIWTNYRLEAPFTQAAGKTFWRFSCAWFVSPEELDRAAEIAKRMPWKELRP